MTGLHRRLTLTTGALALSAIAILSGPGALAQASDLTLDSGGAVKSAVVVAAERLQASTGARLALEFHPMGPFTRKLRAGATPDIVVLTREAMDAIEKTPMAQTQTATEVGRVAIGVAGHESAPMPDFSSRRPSRRPSWRRDRSSTSIPIAARAAGVLSEPGIAEAIKPRTRLGDGGYVVEPVGRGEVEIGVHQITEILPVKGVKLVGPLPKAL